MTHWQVLQGMCPYLDDGDNVVCSRHQGANWEGEEIIGLFENMLIICRATKVGISRVSHRNQAMDCTYLPNEVPRKCEFNQTLAAKAVATSGGFRGTGEQETYLRHH